jgi:NADH:ubiquinone oxidoreductase subunit F (NADH-binding)
MPKLLVSITGEVQVPDSWELNLSKREVIEITANGVPLHFVLGVGSTESNIPPMLKAQMRQVDMNVEYSIHGKDVHLLEQTT